MKTCKKALNKVKLLPQPIIQYNNLMMKIRNAELVVMANNPNEFHHK